MTGGASSSSVHEQGNVPLQCPKLTDMNYTTWALMMETILKAYGLWKVIDAKKETNGKKKTDDEQETAIDEKAENITKGMIFQTLPQDILMQVAQYTTAKEVWNSIKVKYLGADLVQKARLQTLRSELETLKTKPHESASEFAGKLSSIQAKFKSLGGTLKDKVLVRKLLNSVPKKFLPIVASIEQYQEIDTMQFEEAVGRITAFEERLKSQDEPENNYQDKLLMANSNNKSYGKWRGKDFNKETKESMKWKNNPNTRRASTSQETKDKSKLRDLLPAGNPVVPVESIRAISERFANTAYGFFLESGWLTSLLLTMLGTLRVNMAWESSYTRAMIELQADVELKDTIVVAMLKLSGQGFYRCNVQVEYEWKPHRYACCKVFGHIQEECPKNPGLGVVKNLKKPSHSSRGVPVGPKVSFKTAKEIDLVLKKAYCQHIAMGTSNLASNGANSSGLSFWNVETSSIRTTPIVDKIRKIEKLIVDGKLTLMDNDGKPLKRLIIQDIDGELGTNGGTSNLASNRANSSGSLFWNVETSSTRTTPIVDRIGKIEKLIMDEKLTLVNNDGKPLKKVNYPGDHYSEDEVESVDNDMARSMDSEKVGFGT
ncbi:hypothetical protein Tco_1302223 [Tanacetum coccineum]